MTACGTEITRFFTLNKREDWRRGFRVGLDDRADGLSLPMISQVTPEDAVGGLPQELDACDMAAAACGRLYVLDGETGLLWVYRSESGRAEPIDCLRPLVERPCGIAATRDTFFMADQAGREGERLICLDRRDWQILWIACLDRDGAGAPLGIGPWTPLDLCALPGGGVAALSAPEASPQEPERPLSRLEVVEFDARGRLVRVSAGEDLTVRRELALEELVRHTAIDADGEGILWVLDATAPRILKLPLPEPPADPRPVIADNAPNRALAELGADARGFAVDPAGHLFLGEAREVPEEAEDPRLIWTFDGASGEFEVLPGYRGAAHLLEADGRERLYIFDRPSRRIYRLLRSLDVRRQRVRPPGRGRFVSFAFDSGEDATRWHRLRMELDSGDPNTRVRVSYRAADRRGVPGIGDFDDFLADDLWDEKERAALIGAIEDWTPLRDNPQDALLQDRRGRAAEGRYLWLNIELIGSELVSPFVKSLRVEYPRRSLLRYLPSVYQRDQSGFRFAERFLALFETLFGESEEKIDRISRYFDVDAVSGEFLRWLASWVALAAQRDWSDEGVRTLVKESSRLYPLRGTPEGIREIVEILTGETAIIVEPCHLSCAQGEAREAVEKLFGSDPYTFWMLLPPFKRPDPAAGNGKRPLLPEEEWNPRRLRSIHEILEAIKPAHTEARVEALHNHILLGGHSYLEFNSHLAEPYPLLDQGSGYGRESRLEGGPPEPGQTERRSRVGRDTRLT